jgi:hypothetical protein
MTTKTFQKKRPKIPIQEVVELTLRAAADRAASRCHAAPSPAGMHAAFTQEVRPHARLRDC